MVWSSGDQLAIFKQSTVPAKYQISENHVGKTSGSFYKVFSDEFTAGFRLDHNDAIYPYQEYLSIEKLDTDTPISSYRISGLVLPSEQIYAGKSFGAGTFPMTSVSDNYELAFRNLCGGMKIQLCGKCKVKSIKVQGNKGEILAGTSSVDAYAVTRMPTVKITANQSATITLDCGNGVQLNPDIPTCFVMSVLPVKFSNGFTVTVTDKIWQRNGCKR